MRAQIQPAVFDALLTAALFVVSVGPWPELQPPGLLILQMALLWPLVWRRRAPLVAFCAVAAAAFVQWLSGVQPIPADVALLVALYTVAKCSSWPHTLLAGAVLEGGILLASARWGPEGEARFLVPVTFLTAVAIAVASTATYLKMRRAYLTSVEDRAVRLERERDQQARLAVTEERARIAREMHDIVTHNLSVMVALADAAVFAQSCFPGKASDTMRQISDTGRQALTDMRRSLGVLRADEREAQLHPLPGIAQLQALTDQMRAAGLPTALGLEGDPDRVPTTAQLTVYRLVQEALTNTLKHAPPGTRADVRVRLLPGAATIEITDDGRTTQAPDNTTGHGIAGMRERAAAFGGTLHAGPLPGGGWRVSARITLPDVADDVS
ncbi:two-component sensor histidine kinase [Streptomyces lucensis JCM 4490]|uniref:histidine kinase n=1 Tax=Streptomyces lucensis JCM 4490 TaxID=1306176 RepID=A0A918MT19_9ACTN|nr:histidine kinase [Streptomyces lucensis]GGW58840.1 two-component sensor histidine kinase [Streptomyces lucensis JCM 4490]